MKVLRTVSTDTTVRTVPNKITYLQINLKKNYDKTKNEAGYNSKQG